MKARKNVLRIAGAQQLLQKTRLTPTGANLRRPPVAGISAKVRSFETSDLPCGESRRLRMRIGGYEYEYRNERIDSGSDGHGKRLNRLGLGVPGRLGRRNGRPGSGGCCSRRLYRPSRMGSAGWCRRCNRRRRRCRRRNRGWCIRNLRRRLIPYNIYVSALEHKTTIFGGSTPLIHIPISEFLAALRDTGLET